MKLTFLKLYELSTGQPLFPKAVLPATVPFLHTMVIGDYPVDFVKKGKRSGDFFNEDGQFLDLTVSLK